MVKSIRHEKVTYTYECEFCHSDFSSQELAIKCENSHSKKDKKKLAEQDRRNEEARHDAWSAEYERGRDCS
jgi:hypothetical protein